MTPDEPTEQRAEDQDTAIEEAFAAGTLPEDDRRTGHLIQDSGYEAIDGEATPPVSPSCLIDKDEDGLWQVTATYKDGRITISHWPDIRHAQHNTAAWTAANL